MSEAAVVTCPRCGAGVERQWNAVQAQCRYCGTIVDLPRVAPPAPPPYVPPNPPPATATTSYVGSAVWLGVVATLVVSVAGTSFWRASTAQQGTGTAVAAAGPALPRGDVVTKLVAANLHAVDPASIIEQSAAVVKQRGSNCELTYAYIGAPKNGTLDTTGHECLFDWTCHSVDPTKAPGDGDVSDDEWAVRVDSGYLTFEKSTAGTRNRPPWREPGCPFSQAWAAAVASGLPANARVSVYYEEWSSAPTRIKPMIWSLRVDGHDEYERSVDGATCKVLSRK